MNLLASVNNPSASAGHTEAVAFFAIQWIVMIVGAAIHIAMDRRRHGHRPGRAVELGLLWVMVFGGGYAIWGGVGHASGGSNQLAESIGYAPSMFQWEVAWGDIALGLLGVGCAWKALRGHWMTAAVVVLTVQFGGDAIGHLMQWVANDNSAPDNVWALPSDVLQPAVAILLLMAYRHGRGRLVAATDRVVADDDAENPALVRS